MGRLVRIAATLSVVCGNLAVSMASSFAEEFPCQSFRRNTDGSLLVVQRVTFPYLNGKATVNPGSVFRRGTKFVGLDLMALYEKNCGG